MTETAFTLPHFRDKAGNPTCSVGIGPGQTCPFYTAGQFGAFESCWFTGEPLFRRGEDGCRSLTPTKGCPLWQ